MASPLIGITTGHSKNKYGLSQIHLIRTYVDAIINAGGVPIIIPPELDEEKSSIIYDKLDGILFSGGGDIAPEIFNGEPHSTIEGVDEERDRIELSLIQHAIEDKKAFFGICRGLQLLNVALGGTLYTHISDQFNDQIQHDTSPDLPRNSLVHAIEIEKDNLLAQIIGTNTIKVNSWHHQGVKDIPPQLKITARATDGLVEAMELPNHPFNITVQWHPEWMPEDKAMQKLFKAFIKASKA